MLYPYLVAIGVMMVLTSVWFAVQMARQRTFPDASPDEDLLAGKAGCGACSQNGHCETESENGLWRQT